jgi:plastocyanin
MRRKLVPVLAAVAVTAALSVAGVAQAAPTANKKLNGTVGPGFTITVAKKTVKAGTYDIVIQDRSNAHNWHITGPGVNKKTSVSGTGTITLKNVKLKKGTYTIVCDPHASTMRTTLRVT